MWELLVAPYWGGRGLYQHFPTSKDINVQVEIDAFWFLEDLITTLSHTSLTNKSKNCDSAVPTNVNHIFPSFLIHSSGLRNLTGKPASCESWECKAQVSFLWKFQPGASSFIVQLCNTHYQWFCWKDDQRVQLMWDTLWKKIVTLLRLKTIRVWKHFMSCRCGIFEVITGHNISAYQIEARVEQTKIGFCDLSIMTLSLSSQMSHRCRIIPEIKLLTDSHVCNLFEKIAPMKFHDRICRAQTNWLQIFQMSKMQLGLHSSRDIVTEPWMWFCPSCFTLKC